MPSQSMSKVVEKFLRLQELGLDVAALTDESLIKLN